VLLFSPELKERTEAREVFPPWECSECSVAMSLWSILSLSLSLSLSLFLSDSFVL